MPLLPNINVGTAPNDGTGDTIRNAFIKVNENFQFIEAFFPNTDVANLTANITSTGTSTFNIVNGSTIGNAGATFTRATLNAATIGNTGATFTGATLNAATIGNAGTAFVGASISAANIGNTGATITGTTVNASSITGNIVTASQPNITSLGSNSSNLSIAGNLSLNNEAVLGIRAIQTTMQVADSFSGNANVGFTTSNSQFTTFHMNGNINLNLVGTITSGIYKDFYFINSSGSVLLANLFVNSDKTNKGSNSIQIANGTTAFIHIVSTDTTSNNIIAIISNI